jgi:hypothetical protein
VVRFTAGGTATVSSAFTEQRAIDAAFVCKFTMSASTKKKGKISFRGK